MPFGQNADGRIVVGRKKLRTKRKDAWTQRVGSVRGGSYNLVMHIGDPMTQMIIYYTPDSRIIYMMGDYTLSD